MREIKFRGKRIDNGEWVYGDLSQTKHKKFIDNDYDRARVFPETVGQYTGLRDKNGREIYEGDIVHCWGGEYCQGFWEHNKTITIKDLIYDCFMIGEYEFIEVIGNVWENPELGELKKCAR